MALEEVFPGVPNDNFCSASNRDRHGSCPRGAPGKMELNILTSYGVNMPYPDEAGHKEARRTSGILRGLGV